MHRDRNKIHYSGKNSLKPTMPEEVRKLLSEGGRLHIIDGLTVVKDKKDRILYEENK